MKRFYRLVTFGCKVNQYEGELLRQILAQLGWQPARDGHDNDACDALIVNSCTVTRRSDQKCRQALRSLLRQHPHAVALVTGCTATSDPDGLRSIPGVTGVYPDKADVVRHLARLQDVELPPSVPTDRLTGHTTRTRALLKVQDGCDAFCTYCIIPHVRPNPASKPLEAALEETRALVGAGHREIVLTGIHLGRYGQDLDTTDNLVTLCRELLDVEGLSRIRLSSIELPEVSDALEKLLTHEDRLCPHLHVPLQSGDDRVLKLMNRRYSATRFRERALDLLESIPELALTTDCIVGFPGEDDEAFEHTLEVCRTVGFSKIHVFPFSPRQGTPAADMPNRPDRTATRVRRDRLMALSDELGLLFRRRFLNRTVEILVESHGTGPALIARGLTRHGLRVSVSPSSAVRNELVRVRVTSVEPRVMHAAPVLA